MDHNIATRYSYAAGSTTARTACIDDTVWFGCGWMASPCQLEEHQVALPQYMAHINNVDREGFGDRHSLLGGLFLGNLWLRNANIHNKHVGV